MKLSCIVACDALGGIGIGNKLPWHIPQDLAHFKKVTSGKPVVMGKNTFQSLPFVLPGRLNIVISSTLTTVPSGAIVVDSPGKALIHAAMNNTTGEAVVIGGAAIYDTFLDFYDCVYITKVEKEYTTDTSLSLDFLKSLSNKSVWNEEVIGKNEAEGDTPAHTFYAYTRKQLQLF